MTKTVGWLATRVGFTILFLYVLELAAMIVATITLGSVQGWHTKLPGWFENWAIYGICAPLGVAVVVGAVWGMVALIRYWRQP